MCERDPQEPIGQRPDPSTPSELPRDHDDRVPGLLLALLAATIAIGPILQQWSRGFGSLASFALIFGALPLLFLGKGLLKQSGFGQVRVTLLLLGALTGLLNYGFALALQAIPLSLFEFTASNPAALFEGEPLAERLALAIAICLAAPLFEEFAFRGALQPRFAARLTPRWGILVTAIVYAAIHLDVAGFAARVEMGITFGLLAYWSGSIGPAIAAHAVHNAIGLACLYLSQIWPAASEAQQAGVSDGQLWPWAVASLALTGCALGFFHRRTSATSFGTARDASDTGGKGDGDRNAALRHLRPPLP